MRVQLAPRGRNATLPPGQRALDWFPRFGTHLDRPPPVVPANPVLTISGAGVTAFDMAVADLTTLPRCEVNADFHCVSGWSATGLRWEGVAFETFYRNVIEPRLAPGVSVTHLVVSGLDGHQSAVLLADALGADVLIADRLNDAPLDDDHGAPARFVSPSQYGYVSTKHLCAIELHTSEPTAELGAATQTSRVALRGPLVMRHPRARVWEEERHPYLPARFLRPLYRLVIPTGVRLGARGSRRGRSQADQA